MTNFKDGQDHKDRYFFFIVSQEIAICNMEAIIINLEVRTNVILIILVKCHGQKAKYQQKDHICITRNTHVNYQRSTCSTNCLKVIIKVKVSDRFT